MRVMPNSTELPYQYRGLGNDVLVGKAFYGLLIGRFHTF